MKKMNLIKPLLLSIGVMYFFSGCATDNPFGIGYDKSACEAGNELGFCGRPEDIYKYKRRIKQVQQDYIKSGISQKLYFAITKDGTILVKDDRKGPWVMYNISKWKRIIEARLRKAKVILSYLSKKQNYQSSQKQNYQNKFNKNQKFLPQDIVVTKGNDLSVAYNKQGSILQTRTNVGNIIRDSGFVQKVWIAPYVDDNNNLVTAHEIFVVIRNPKWIVGEKKPKYVSSSKIGEIPTPISKSILEEQQKYNTYDEKVINYYNTDAEKQLQQTLKNNPYKQEKKQNKKLNLIYNFLMKKK